MYSFQALADTSQSHVGFYVVAVLAVIIFFASIAEDYPFISGTTIGGVLFSVLFLGSAYAVSFGDKPPVNEVVTGEFVGFQPEGYREQTGKTRSDRHYMYVVYKVDGNLIILQGVEGAVYPKFATLYKN